MSSDAPVLAPGECAALVPQVARDANKYSRGMLAVVGGSGPYPAAPVMATQAGMRAGAGYVRLFAPTGAAQVARAHLLSAPVTACTQTACGAFDPECAADVVAGAAKARAFVVGPGMGATSFVGEFLGKFLERLAADGDARPLLIDADALGVLAAHPELAALRAGCTDVLTPHEGEAARLLGRRVDGRLADARRLAREHGSVVVLKGPDTLIVAPDGSARTCSEGGPELAKAGTGDVLAGIIGAFLAQGLAPYDAACLGCFLHGRAGKLAAARFSVNAVMAEDIIGCIGEAFISLEAQGS